ncbi:sulfite exporter TauE/SafE family protein [Clostridium sp. Cult3]|uniref:sulfite exporter TauE/SafE family protein n=1 Tax=Clostridium sp. Cult3 TaxID=2079004 RepID=UPI0023512518|nr:sulfite exporter TauE/SafE family protein [Clostridium sp. Cult3]MCF6460744.1 sulfite exporter TauE/SafE family protein [Clostridium sp. Cult3]
MVKLIISANKLFPNHYTIKEESMDTKVFKLIGIGLITGITNGLFGSGGGTLVVPALVFFLGFENYKAHATAISIILPLSIISTFIYIKKNVIEYEVAMVVALGGILGSFLGAKLLKKIPTPVLRKIFGTVIIITAIRMIFK